MWIYSSYHKQLSAESLSFYSTKMLSCSSLIPFNNSWTLWGPRRPLATDRVFRNVGSWSSVFVVFFIVHAVVFDIVMMPICVLDFANRGYKRCLHMICFNVSFALYIFPSALCASYFVVGFWRISIVSGLSSFDLEFLLDRCAELFV